MLKRAGYFESDVYFLSMCHKLQLVRVNRRPFSFHSLAIERYWSASKRHARHNCTYSFKDLRINVPKALDSVPLYELHRYFRKSAHFLSLYSLIDCSPGLIEFLANEPFKSHRRVSKNDSVRFLTDLKESPKLSPKQKVMLNEMEKAMQQGSPNE